jgi:hypothetical protein
MTAPLGALRFGVTSPARFPPPAAAAAASIFDAAARKSNSCNSADLTASNSDIATDVLLTESRMYPAPPSPALVCDLGRERPWVTEGRCWPDSSRAQRLASIREPDILLLFGLSHGGLYERLIYFPLTPGPGVGSSARRGASLQRPPSCRSGPLVNI